MSLEYLKILKKIKKFADQKLIKNEIKDRANLPYIKLAQMPKLYLKSIFQFLDFYQI